MTQRHRLSNCCWKNGADRLAWFRLTNLQFVKSTVSVKHNQMRLCHTANKWSGWGLNPHVYDPKLWSITLEVEPGKVGAHSFDSETHVFSPPENRLHCIINGVSRLLLAWWQVTHLSLPGAFWQGFFFFLKCQCQTLKNECLLEIKSQRLWWNTLLRNVISPKLLMSQKMIVYEKHKHQWLWVEKRLTKVKFRRQRCYGITWPTYFADVYHFIYAQ